jgi:hypothetical protein
MIEGWFGNSERFKRSDWGYVYCHKAVPNYQGFLCSNWAGYRIRNLVKYGEKCPHDAAVDTTDYDVEHRNGLLGALGLYDKSKGKYIVEECSNDDKNRVSTVNRCDFERCLNSVSDAYNMERSPAG